MSLDRLVEEIRSRGEAERQQESERQAKEEAAIAADRDKRISSAQADARRRTDAEITRERARRVAAAKLQARKSVFEAREREMNDSLEQTRELLAEFTEADDYPKVVKRMVDYATAALGKGTKLMGRSDDAALLKKVAGASFDPTPQSILGGVIAESSDGARRLNLSFDELLRLREPKVRELLGR